MTAPHGAPPTEVEPGRRALDRGEPTEIEPGRSRPRGAGRALPRLLAERFRIELDITGPGGQGDVFHVVRRSDGAPRVLKVHRPGWLPDERVVAFLRGECPAHVVGCAETGVEDDRFYEVMPHLTGGTLLDLRLRHPAGVAPDVVAEVVRQLADGLAAVQQAGIVHRDLKPANILVAGLEPLTVAIADFGIALHVPAGEAHTDEGRIGTVPYTPPEFHVGLVRPAFDWWSLGVCAAELATGQPLFPGITVPQVIRDRLASGRPIDTGAVADEGLRLLCDGLLTMDPDHRWGAEEVAAWLRGERPAVSTPPPRPADDPRAGEPYVFAGRQFWDREDLAAALVNDWGLALSVLCGKNPEPARRLSAWLAAFPDDGARVPPPRRRAPADVRLLHLVRAVAPAFPPWYRRWNIAPGPLAQLAQEGYEGIVPSTDVVAELWDYELLPLLASGGARGEASSGLGLQEVRRNWRTAWDRLAERAAAVANADARRAAEVFLREERERALSLALLAATATAEHTRTIRRELDEQARAFRLDWFSELVRNNDCRWIAMALVAHAEAESARLADERRAQEAHEAWLRRTESLRDWSRRQNRPQALSYAAAGVAAVTAFLLALLGLSDVAEVASDAQIVDSWVGLAAAALLVLVSESLLAWESGGRFHPAYSLLGAGRVALGRLARRLLARRTAVPAALAAVAGLAALTVVAPLAAPFLAAFLILPWTVQRSMAWRAQDRREREILARAGGGGPSSHP
ncbi:serine/threonine protein kinase [Amycolatopsis sp. FU40]|uniref:serine/threonine-protein kinase n=1 Tax=Amycolatopsis sp. FU40 TaxID=2914159 RepID=UPI001F3F4371|nr:serine/threonine-protein kinase [Amycolatopsis sp. FU40]UKD57155.1 serine/threonine protein kinase [Amycolatopsis sp. FU40]